MIMFGPQAKTTYSITVVREKRKRRINWGVIFALWLVVMFWLAIAIWIMEKLNVG